MGLLNQDDSGPITLGLLTDLLGYKLRHAQLYSIEKFRLLSSNLGITSGQAGALILIASNPGVSQSDLARAMRIERATMGTTISRMISRGWIDRRLNKDNRRAYCLFLSETGRILMQKLIPLLREHESAITENLTESEARALSALLKKMAG